MTSGPAGLEGLVRLGMKEAEEGNWKLANNYWEEAARAGSVAAMFRLGVYFLHKEAYDPRAAARYLAAAARQKDRDSASYLARLWAGGAVDDGNLLILAPRPEEAARWGRIALLPDSLLTDVEPWKPMPLVIDDFKASVSSAAPFSPSTSISMSQSILSMPSPRLSSPVQKLALSSSEESISVLSQAEVALPPSSSPPRSPRPSTGQLTMLQMTPAPRLFSTPMPEKIGHHPDTQTWVLAAPAPDTCLQLLSKDLFEPNPRVRKEWLSAWGFSLAAVKFILESGLEYLIDFENLQADDLSAVGIPLAARMRLLRAIAEDIRPHLVKLREHQRFYSPSAAKRFLQSNGSTVGSNAFCQPGSDDKAGKALLAVVIPSVRSCEVRQLQDGRVSTLLKGREFTANSLDSLSAAITSYYLKQK